MAPIIGYSNTRVNAPVSSENKDEFGKWLHTPNFRAVKTAANVQNVENRNRQASFASLLKQAEQENGIKSSNIELRPANRQSFIDILA